MKRVGANAAHRSQRDSHDQKLNGISVQGPPYGAALLFKQKNRHTMPIILTSFHHAHNYSGTAYSVARSQPKNSFLPPLQFLAATDSLSNPLFLLEHSPENFAEAYRAGLQSRWPKVHQWLSTLDRENTIILCCWCPYSFHSKSRMQQTNTIFCHNLLIGKMLNRHRPDISILLDPPRFSSSYSPWRPESFPAPDCTPTPSQLTLF